MADEKQQGALGDNSGKGAKDEKGKVVSATPENARGTLNPSAPGNTGTTPGTDA